MKILVASPAIDRADWYFTSSVANMMAFSATVPGVEVGFLAARGYGGVDHACNMMVKEVLGDPECRGLLILGSDAHVHPHTLVRLLQHQTGIVGALCFKREPPYTPVVGDGKKGFERFWVEEVRDWIVQYPELITKDEKVSFGVLNPRPDDALRQCDLVGTHTMLVHRYVLENMKPPWFWRDETSVVANKEDVHFLVKAREAGFPAHVDLSVVSGHVNFGARDFWAWYNYTEWDKANVTLKYSDLPPAGEGEANA